MTTTPQHTRYAEPTAADLHQRLPSPPAGHTWESHVTRTSRNDWVFSFHLTSATCDIVAPTARINITRHGTSIITERARHLIHTHAHKEDRS